jgi:thioredoxin
MKQKMSVGVLLLVLLAFNSFSQAPVLEPKTFDSSVSGKQVQLLDVRTKDEYAKGHLANSMHADWNDKNEFRRRTEFLDKSAPVYVYCLSGGRSHAAAEALRKNGYSVYELKGGLTAWKGASLPVEQPEGTKDLTTDEFYHIVGKQGTVLVDFGAPWCPPCRQMTPVVDEFEKSEKDVRVVRLNADESATTMKALKIDALPTFIIFKNGTETWRKVGIAKMAELKKQTK